MCRRNNNRLTGAAGATGAWRALSLSRLYSLTMAPTLDQTGSSTCIFWPLSFRKKIQPLNELDSMQKLWPLENSLAERNLNEKLAAWTHQPPEKSAGPATDMVSVLNELNVDGKKKTDIHRTCSLYTWGNLQSRQFQRHQVHHRLLLSLLLRASMISRLDESRSQKRSQIRIFCGLEVVCPAGLKHPRNRFPIASQGTTLPRLPLTNFMLPSIWVMVFPRPKAFKSNSCSALRVMFCSLKTSSSLSMMRHACDMPATCLRHACDMPAMLHHPYQKGFNTERKEWPGLHTTKEKIQVHRPLYRNNVANRQARPGLWSQWSCFPVFCDRLPGNEACRSSTSYFMFACLAFRRSEEFLAFTASDSASSAALSLAKYDAGESRDNPAPACLLHPSHLFEQLNSKSLHAQQRLQILLLCLQCLSQPDVHVMAGYQKELTAWLTRARSVRKQRF